MRLPDPSTPNLKVPVWSYEVTSYIIEAAFDFLPSIGQIDLLEEMSQAPRILSEVDAAIKAKQMKADVDEYLRVLNANLLLH